MKKQGLLLPEKIYTTMTMYEVAWHHGYESAVDMDEILRLNNEKNKTKNNWDYANYLDWYMRNRASKIERALYEI